MTDRRIKLTVTLDPETVRRLRERAATERRPLSRTLELAVEQYLASPAWESAAR